jgi:hypothetical protein
MDSTGSNDQQKLYQFGQIMKTHLSNPTPHLFTSKILALAVSTV